MLAQLSSLGGSLLGGAASKSQADLAVGILNSESVQDELVQKFHLDAVFHEKKPSLLRKQLAAESRFDIDPKSSIITIKVTDKVAKRAQALASGYLDALRDTNSRMALLDSSQRRLFYSQQLASEKDALASAEVALKQVEEQSGLIAPVGQTAERIQAESSLRAQLTAREVQLAALLRTETEQNPDVVSLRSEVASLSQHLTTMQSGTIGGDTAPSSNKLPEVQLDYIRKAREVKYHEALFEILARQYEAARLDESHESPMIQVLDNASLPDTKSGPHRVLLTAVAFVIGLIAGALYVWLKATWPGFQARVAASIDGHLTKV